jgi:hypothetical protein
MSLQGMEVLSLLHPQAESEQAQCRLPLGNMPQEQSTGTEKEANTRAHPQLGPPGPCTDLLRSLMRQIPEPPPG